MVNGDNRANMRKVQSESNLTVFYHLWNDAKQSKKSANYSVVSLLAISTQGK